MAENESIEGKDFAKQERKKAQFEQIIINAINNKEKGQTEIYLQNGFIQMQIRQDKNIYKLNLLGENIATINENGEFEYNVDGLENVKKKLEESDRPIADYDDLGLPDIEYLKYLEKEKTREESEEKKDNVETKKEEQEKEENEDDAEKNKEEIAEELGIKKDKIYPIRSDSAFYKNHLGMFRGKDLFFFEDEQGKIRVGTRDENGKLIEDKEHFALSSVGKMEPVIRLGDGREDVRKEIPIQTIEIKNPAKQNGEDDVRDRYIAVFRGAGGYLEFEEVEQSREEGKPGVAERIEISGRKYNTQEINERTENRGVAQKPGETIRNYKGIEATQSADDGIQTDEIFSDNETFKKQIEKDLTKTYGPMKPERLREMRENVISRLEAGEHYDTAIARAGIEERTKDGPTPEQGKRKREM